MSDAAALARWLGLLQVIGWGFYPLLFLATPGLPDRGLAVAKPFGLLLLSYPAWFLASATGLPAFTVPILTATLGIFSAAAWALALWRGHARSPRPSRFSHAARDGGQPVPCPDLTTPDLGILPFLRQAWRYAVGTEALFVATLLGYAWLRGFNPEILGTEKPMDMGFLTSSMRGSTMPPPDPWLSGYGINYYYLGFAITGALGKIGDIPPSIVFNLALATVVAATFVGATGVTANLLAAHSGRLRLRHLAGGLLGGYLVALAGNMYAARDILSRGQAAIDSWWWAGLGWKSSRVVIDSGFPARFFGPNAPASETINEFPFFSFILGDLHAHVLALPFTLLALAFALDAWLHSPLSSRVKVTTVRTERVGATRPWGHVLPDAAAIARLLAAALVVGSLYALNSWDLPTYAAIYIAALLIRPLLRAWPARREWIGAALFAGLAVTLFAPFYLRFTSLVGGERFNVPEPWASVPLLSRVSRVLGLVIWRKTPTDQFLTVYLLPLVTALVFLLWRWWNGAGHYGRRSSVPVLTSLGLALAATLLQMPVLFFAGLVALLATAVLRSERERESDGFVALLFGGAMALVLVTEIFFIHDVFGNRMNTVFKVYYQAWTLLGVASGFAIARLLVRPHHGLQAAAGRAATALTLLVLLLASAAYPVAGSWARTEHFAHRAGLDGMAYLQEVAPDEYAGITWARDHLAGGTVVAEAPGCSYGEWSGMPHDRVSVFAGTVTPLGWIGHERQWRGGDPALLEQLGERQHDVNTLYSTTDRILAQRILDKYGIEYVYVGRFERQGYTPGGIGADCAAGPPYSAAGLAKFATLMTLVYQGGDVAIYGRR